MEGWLLMLARLVVGAVFLMAGLAKLGATDKLEESVSRYQLGIRGRPARLIATALPPAEIGLGTVLVLGFAPLAFAILAACTLTGFVLIQAVAVVRGLPVQCSCFGILYVEPVGARTIIRDGTLVVLAFFLVATGGGGYLLWRELLTVTEPSAVVASSLTIGIALATFVVGIRAWKAARSGRNVADSPTSSRATP